MLSGYARALGEHPGGLSRARVLRAFREALAASAGAPLVSFDVADSLADWASRNQLWPQTAQAYRMAADARRTLSAAQLDRVYQDTWLARGTDIGAAEAQAWIRSGQPRQAAVALDAGRALALSEALDTRGAPAGLSRGTTANSPTGTSALSTCSGGPLPPGSRRDPRAARCRRTHEMLASHPLLFGIKILVSRERRLPERMCYLGVGNVAVRSGRPAAMADDRAGVNVVYLAALESVVAGDAEQRLVKAACSLDAEGADAAVFRQVLRPRAIVRAPAWRQAGRTFRPRDRTLSAS